MDINELYLKTLFCCSACDGDIAKEEIDLVKNITKDYDYFKELQVENTLNSYISEINVRGKSFLRNYLTELSEVSLSENEQLILIDLAIKMIEADNLIQYSEVKFFKKIRNRLTVSDDVILARFPNYEDYLLPDISTVEKDFEDIGNFQMISFNSN